MRLRLKPSMSATAQAPRWQRRELCIEAQPQHDGLLALAPAAELHPVAARRLAATALAWPCRPLRQAAGGRAHRGRQPPSSSAAAAAALSAAMALQPDRWEITLATLNAR